jgi:hypothetical protein
MLRTKSALIGTLIVTAATVAAVIYLSRRESVFLTAKEPVPVFATVGESMASAAPHPISELEQNQRVPVLQCVDVKVYLVYKIRLPDGKVGYVNYGKYDLNDKNGSLVSCL